MNWNDYDVFCRVIENNGFSAAARVLDQPKSTISAAIVRLEAQLGARLLERTTRQVRLTDAGKTLYQSVGPLFAGLREARTDALAQGDVVSGTLRIAASYVFAAKYLGPVACELMARWPQLKVCIDVENVAINPLERGYDIAFAILDEELPASSLVVRRMFSFERGVFASPELIRQWRAPARPQDLAGLPLVGGMGESEWAFASADGNTELVPIVAPRMWSGNVDVRMQAAIAGLGVARLTATLCASAVHSGQLVRLLPEHPCVPLRVYALLPSKRLMPARVRVFLDALGANKQSDAGRQAG